MMKKLVKWIQSVRLAIALILVLAILGLTGVFLPQVPAAFSASPDGYAWWVENVAYAELGGVAYTLEPLGFFHIFRSVWFVAAVSLLMLNILACTVLRVNALRAQTQKTGVRTEADFYGQGNGVLSFEKAGGIDVLAERTREALQEHRFAVARKDTAGAVYFAGDKRRASPWGTLPVHLSLILLLAGVMTGALFGFQEQTFTVAEGTARAIGHGTNLSVYLQSFTDTYWEDGTPRDYSSDVRIEQDGETVKTGTIRVNHPLSYRGVRIHQGYFGQAARLTVTSGDGTSVYQAAVALTGERPAGSLSRPEAEVILPDTGYRVFLLGTAANGADPYIGADQIGVEVYDADMQFIGWLLLDGDSPGRIGSLSIACESIQYAGFLVSRDPGVPLIWIAAVLFLCGLGMLFYFPRRQLWISLRPAADNRVRIVLKTGVQREPEPGSGAMKIANALGYRPEGGGKEF